jgi:hypothetical protein
MIEYRYAFENVFDTVEWKRKALTYGTPHNTLLECVDELKRKYAPLFGDIEQMACNIEFEWRHVGNVSWSSITGYGVMKQVSEELGAEIDGLKAYIAETEERGRQAIAMTREGM